MENNNSNSGTKILFGIGLGLLAGGAAGYYLASEEGKELRAKASEKFNELEKEVRSTLKEQNEVIASKLNTAAESSNEWIETAKSTAQDKFAAAKTAVEDKLANISEKAEEVENGYEAGVNRAKAKIEAHKQSLNGVV